MITAYLKQEGKQLYIETRDDSGALIDLIPVDDINDEREE
jgi:hypothetical protein